MTTRIRTVRGDIDPGDLGAAYAHEHLITFPAEHLQDRGDLVLDDEARAIEALRHFAMAGGGGLIECTAPEFGRDPEALRRISEHSGVHVVAVTGHVCEEYWRGVVDVAGMTEDDLLRDMVHDLTHGMQGTQIRAGAIKAGSSLDVVTPGERRVLRAAARAQAETGAPITTHTTAGSVPDQQLEILVDAGATPERICLGHLDRRLDWDQHLQLVRAGVYLGYDCMSKDWYEPDARRVEFVGRFVEAGHGTQLLVAGDLARRSQLTSWGGGPGYVHILWRIVPWLHRVGVSVEDTDVILRDNPARFLTWA